VDAFKFLDKFLKFYENLKFLETNELSLCNKLWFINTYMFSSRWCKPLYFKLRGFHLTEFKV